MALLQVGKHLGDVSHALPLRCVCKEWREVATLGSVEAVLDLEPRLKQSATDISAKEQLFFKHCRQLRKLTYHVSPWVSLAQVGGAILAAAIAGSTAGVLQGWCLCKAMFPQHQELLYSALA